MDINIPSVKSTAEGAQSSPQSSFTSTPYHTNHDESLAPTSSGRKVRVRKKNKQGEKNLSKPAPGLQGQPHLPGNPQQVTRRTVCEPSSVLSLLPGSGCQTVSSGLDKTSEYKKITSETHEFLCRYGVTNEYLSKEDTGTYQSDTDHLEPESDQITERKKTSSTIQKTYIPNLKTYAKRSKKNKKQYSALQKTINLLEENLNIGTDKVKIPCNRKANYIKKHMEYCVKQIIGENIQETLSELKKCHPSASKGLKKVAFTLSDRLKKMI